MKTIKLNESQMCIFAKIMESETGAPDFEDGDIKEYGDTTESSPTATIQDDEGNPKYGTMPLLDKITTRMHTDKPWASSYGPGGWSGPAVR